MACTILRHTYIKHIIEMQLLYNDYKNNMCKTHFIEHIITLMAAQDDPKLLYDSEEVP
jgi:hypothetical protein